MRCRFLAAQGQGRWACSVYEERFEKAPWCHHADAAVGLGFLARDCPYVVAAGGRRGKIRLREPLLTATWPRLLAAIVAQGVPEYIDTAAFLQEVERRQGKPYHLLPWPNRDGWLRLIPPDEVPA